ncbi:MAG: hypothetical protein GEU71_03045 [Actinobacteria bacterium]|nr:hypothetical protein [Actinomycetota bacterium]
MRSDLPYFKNALYTSLLDAHRHLYKVLQSHGLGDRTHLSVDVVNKEGRVEVSSVATELSNARAVVASIQNAVPPLEPGDVVVTNDPYSGSQHLQDHWIVAPVAKGTAAGGYISVHAHLADVGGRNLGNLYPGARDIWQEGVRTTPVRLFRKGELDRDVLELIKLNSRMPLVMENDLREMATTASELASQVGASDPSLLADLRSQSKGVFARPFDGAEGRTTTKRGTIHSCQGSDATVVLETRVENGALVVDLTGSSDQAEPGFFNSTIANTQSFLADVLANRLSGVFSSDVLEALDVRAAEASVLNCSFPLPVGWSPYGPRKVVTSLFQSALRELGIGEDYQVFESDWRPPVHIEGCRETECPF